MVEIWAWKLFYPASVMLLSSSSKTNKGSVCVSSVPLTCPVLPMPIGLLLAMNEALLGLLMPNVCICISQELFLSARKLHARTQFYVSRPISSSLS